MQCATCDKRLQRSVVREEAGGKVLYFCSLECFHEGLRRREGTSKGIRPAV